MSELILNLDDNYSDYLRDESRKKGNAETISFPKNEGELVRVVQSMFEQNIPTTTQGAKTGLAAGAVPNGGHVINLSRMNKLTNIEAKGEHFFVTVQPGLSLSDLRKMLATRNMDSSLFGEQAIKAYADFCRADMQFFSADPTEESASIGGMVSCNASGARSFCYGSVRSYIQKLRIVLANGETLELTRGEQKAQGNHATLTTEQGSKYEIDLPTYAMPSVKNASGYFAHENMDLIDLFIGADGTLGIVSEIVLELLPMPKIIWGCTAFFKTEEYAIEYVNAVRAKGSIIKPASIEFFNCEALQILRNAQKNMSAFSQIHKIPEQYNCAVYCEEHSECEEDITARLLEMGRQCEKSGGNAGDTWVARNSCDLDNLMFFRHAIPECVNMIIDARHKIDSNITKLGTDMAVPDCELASIMKIYRKQLTEANLDFAIWGHIGDNHLHVNILPRNVDEYNLGYTLYESWAKTVCACGGAVSAEHGVGKIKKRFLKIMYGEHGVAQMRSLKRALDEKMLLNRGNMFDCEVL